MSKKKNYSLEHKLRNKLNREQAMEKLAREDCQRVTVSLYRYVPISDPVAMRHLLFQQWSELGVLGRVYIAKEGINAQICLPEEHLETFREILYTHSEFADVRLNVAVEESEMSFYKLTIKVKDQIVADNLPEGSYDMTCTGQHLDAEDFNKLIADPESVVIDMRNHYESRIGHFEDAVCPDADTFSDELKMVEKMLEDKKDKKVVMYCTGGIRCEKASAYLKKQGFEDVYQLNGGIINYFNQVREHKLPCKFKGKNFVFDDRLAEKITDDVLSHCDQCDKPADRYVNCRNTGCNLLFLQCECCEVASEGCCSDRCQEIIHWPEAKQKEWRRNNPHTNEVYKKSLRPKLQF